MTSCPLIVTGGAGYVGSHFVARLEDESRRYVVLDDLSRGSAGFVSPGNLVVGDIADEELVVGLCRDLGVRVAVHFAAYAYVGESVAEPERYYDNNVGKTVRLLRGLRRAGVNAFVFSSSCATYGEPPTQGAIAEKTSQNPVNPYGRSKLMVERILGDYEAAYGLRSISLRYFNAAGASGTHALYEQHDPETHLIPLAIGASIGESTLEIFGNDYATPDGTCVRDYIHVDDLADAHIRAVDRLAQGGDSLRANLGIGQGASIMEIIAAVKAATQCEVRYQFAPRREGDPPVLVADARCAHRELGWHPRYEGVEPIVRTALEGYRRKQYATSMNRK